MVVKEGDSAVLPCSPLTKENMESKLFDWKKGQLEVFMYDAGRYYDKDLDGQDEQFKGRVSHFHDQLQFGNTSIIITNTKTTDTGNYTCAFPRLPGGQTYDIELVVGEYFIKTVDCAFSSAVMSYLHPTLYFVMMQPLFLTDKCTVHCSVLDIGEFLPSLIMYVLPALYG